ncbi:hypothetical protein Tco_0863964 [Tanacetum coccineum]
MTTLWEVPKTKKPTMPMKVTEEEDIEETTMVGVPEIGETNNQEMKTKIPNLDRTFLPFHQHLKQSSIIEQGQKNHQASIQDLETKIGRLSDQCSFRPTGSLPSNTQTNLTYDSPVNPHAKTTVIHDDSEDEVDETEKEIESSSSK